MMKSAYFPSADFSSLIAITLDQPYGAEKPTIRVKELSERDRRCLLMHFLALDDNDRLLRFGNVLSDEMIARYVQMLDFSRSTVFGVYDIHLDLVGVGHVTFAAKEAMPALSQATTKARIAEFDVSVLPAARGMGVGSKLFARAAVYCRNEDVDTLYMRCPPSSQIIHIAKKAGMEVFRGEADVYLKLAPATAPTMLTDAVEQERASFDRPIRETSKTVTKWWQKLSRS